MFQKNLSLAENVARLKKIKLLLLDVDGVLTDSNIYWIESQGWTRTYSTRDGYGIRMIQELGIQVGIMSGGGTKDVQERIKILNIKHAVLGSHHKGDSLDVMMKETGVPLENICYVGDELFDLPALRRVALAVTVPDAPIEVKKECHAVTQARGGHGAVREVIDAIRIAQGIKHPYE